MKCFLEICPLLFSQPGCTQASIILRGIMLWTCIMLRPMSFLTKCYFYQIQLRGQQHQVTLSAPWSTVLQLAITGWGQGMAQTPPAVPHILSLSCYRNRRSHKLSLLDVNKQPHYFAESTLENQRPHHFILAQINEERLWGFFSLSTMKRGRVMVHLCTFAVFMFYVLESDFHLHYTSLMPSLH